MRFVPVKSPEQQAALSMQRSRDLLVKQRTQLINMIRGLLAEFGVDIPKELERALRMARWRGRGRICRRCVVERRRGRRSLVTSGRARLRSIKRSPLKITSRTSSITNSFVQAIIPTVSYSEEQRAEALAKLGMTMEKLSCIYCRSPTTDWANETVDGLDATAEALRRAAEDTPSGASPDDVEKTPVFDRADLAPKI
jgi:hypothetical protein